MSILRAVLFMLTSSSLASPLEELIKVTGQDEGPTHYEYGPFPSEEGIIIDDIRINTHRNALSVRDIKWPSGRVPYVLNSQFSSEIQNTITAAMREIEQDVNGPTVCVKFIPKTNEVNFIDIYPGTGCHTEVGTSYTGRQLVSIGRGCESRGVILHELIHVLGFSHEHSRLDRNSYINVNMTNVMRNHTLDYLPEPIDTLNTTYDFSSMTHYDPYTHAVDPSIPVITPKRGQAVGVKLGQRMALSDGDVIRIQRLYNCQEDTSHISRIYITDGVLRCDFGSDLCNLTHNTTTPSFQWEVKLGASGAGPRAGNTNGADSYLVARENGQNGTARIVTPFFRVGNICMNFFLFQRGPSSFLNVVARGPRIARTVITSYEGNNSNRWRPAAINITVPMGAAFRITFEAEISMGDVAIDDVYIYKGACL